MITPSCTKLECAPKDPEEIPGVSMPCGGGADCPPDAGGGLTAVATGNSTSVTLTGDGTAGSPLVAEVLVSEESPNLLQVTPDGLRVVLPEFASFFDLAVSVTGEWAQNEVIFAHMFSALSNIPANWDQAIGIVEGHVGDTTLTVEKNGIVISTIDINGEVITFPPMAAQVFARGDILTVTASSVATFEYAALTLVASRSVRYA